MEEQKTYEYLRVFESSWVIIKANLSLALLKMLTSLKGSLKAEQLASTAVITRFLGAHIGDLADRNV